MFFGARSFCKRLMRSVLAHGSRGMSGIPSSSQATLLQHLTSKIRFNGPITVADYMKEVLTNAAGGYYMHRDVFGQHGDFTTSPEISQMFGELLGVWCLSEWVQAGAPGNLQVVELGPGRGTLADDMLRVIGQFPGMHDAISLHLVEVSPHLSDMQYSKLTGSPSDGTSQFDGSSDPCYRSCVSQHQFKVHWYRQLSDVPKAPSFFVAHEFFDALPVHKFQKRDGAWHEVLVDVNDDGDELRYVLSPNETPASQLQLKLEDDDCRDHIEVCLEAGVIAAEIANRISRYHGFALIADYGHSGDKTDTFRAFRDHKLFDPLTEPGTADLTADVDFKYLMQCVADKVLPVGPIIQDQFLHNMGIVLRLQMLMSNATDKQKDSLLTGYDMLTNHSKMGERFKFLALLPKSRNPSYRPAGFVEPASSGAAPPQVQK